MFTKVPGSRINDGKQKDKGGVKIEMQIKPKPKPMQKRKMKMKILVNVSVFFVAVWQMNLASVCECSRDLETHGVEQGVGLWALSTPRASESSHCQAVCVLLDPCGQSLPHDVDDPLVQAYQRLLPLESVEVLAHTHSVCRERELCPPRMFKCSSVLFCFVGLALQRIGMRCVHPSRLLDSERTRWRTSVHDRMLATKN